AGRPDSGVQSLPCQSIRCSGTSSVLPSHQTELSSVRATLVKIVLPLAMARMALGLVDQPVPGATPKRPDSGLTTKGLPSRNSIQAMSSPTISAFHPSMVGSIIAKLVLPQAEGKAAEMYLLSPRGLVILSTSMCSAIQPS